MADLAILLARLDALKKARSLGVTTVTKGDRTIQYRSDKEMAAAITALENEIAGLQGIRRPRRTVASYSGGF